MLYEVTLFSTYLGQRFVNRWNYISSGIPATVSGSFGLARALGFLRDGGVYPANALFAGLRGLVSSSTVFTSVSVRAPRDYAPQDFYETPFIQPTIGVQGGDPASPVLAFGFRTTRTRTDIRRATKRFGGVSEEAVAGGGNVTGDYVAIMATLATFMSATVSYNDEGNTITYSPAVCKKLRVVDPVDGSISYQYYPTLAQQEANLSVGFLWEPYSQIRSQVSRQYGRGI